MKDTVVVVYERHCTQKIGGQENPISIQFPTCYTLVVYSHVTVIESSTCGGGLLFCRAHLFLLPSHGYRPKIHCIFLLRGT